MPVLFYVVSAVVVGGVLLLAYAWRTLVTLPNRPAFEGKTLQAWLDPEKRVLCLMPRGEVSVRSVPFGRMEMTFREQSYESARNVYHAGNPGRVVGQVLSSGVIDSTVFKGTEGWTETVYETTYTGNSTVTLSAIDVPGHLHRQWCGEDTKATKTMVYAGSLEGRESQAFERWLWRHANVLRPDVDGLRKQWASTCASWLAASRRQRTHKGKPVVEGHAFGSAGIRYLCVEDDGTIHAARGDAPLLIDVTRLTKWDAGKLTVSRGHADEMAFDLDEAEVAALQKLVRKGKLRFD
jgi:hypothetical protein